MTYSQKPTKKSSRGFVQLCLLPLSLIFLSGCSQFGVSSLLGTGVNDFEKTEILPGTPVYANGSEQLLVAIHLKNSDSSSVPNFRPELETIEGTGVIPTVCSTSDSNGVAICLVKAIVAGRKVVRLTNGKVGLESEIEFKAPTGLQRLAVLPGSNTSATTANGSKVQVHFGQPFGGVKHTTSGGYKVTFSLQGVAN